VSVHEGKKIIQAIEEFNKSGIPDPDRSPIALIAQTLQRRELGEKHFAQMHDFINNTRKAAIIKVAEDFGYDPAQPLSKRNLHMFLCYMSTNSRDGEAIYDEYGPQIMQIKLMNNMLAYIHRSIPVIFSSQHTEFRFIQRTGEKLDYASDDSQWAVMTALMMAMTIIEPMHAEKQTYTPIAFPYANGLYLGYAARCHREDYYPQEYVLAVHGEAGKKSMLHGIKDGLRVITEPDWSPQTQLMINTFISKREFHSDQAELYDSFLKFFREPRALRAYNYLINSYTNLMPGTQAESNDLQWLKEQFQAVYKSPVWASVTKFAQKHLPRPDLA